MDISILTLFPGMFAGPLDQSILGRACERGLVSISLHNIRDHAHDRHHVVDDSPFGGGPGMVMKPEPLFLAAEAVKTELAARRGPAVAGRRTRHPALAAGEAVHAGPGAGAG